MLKKWLALFLVLVMVLSLCACSGDDGDKDDRDDKNTSDTQDNDKDQDDETKESEKPSDETPAPTESEPADDDADLYNTWEYDIDVTDQINSMVVQLTGDESLLPTQDLICPMYLTLEDDGSMNFLADTDTFQVYMLDYLDELREVLKEIVYQTAEAQGISREDFDAQIVAQGYDSLDSYLDESMDLDSLMDIFGEADFDVDGVYKVEDGKLYLAKTEADFADDGIEYTLNGDKLSLTGLVDCQFMLDTEFGLEELELDEPLVFVCK